MASKRWNRALLFGLGAIAALAVAAACNKSSTAGPTGLRGLSLHQVVQVSLEAPAEAQVGDTVPLVLKVQNITGAPLEIWGGMQSPEVVALTEDGAPVWNYWHERAADLALRRFDFAPGETKDYELEWELLDNEGSPVPAGGYDLQGTFMAATRSSPTSQEVFEVVPAPRQRLIVTSAKL